MATAEATSVSCGKAMKRDVGLGFLLKWALVCLGLIV